jgi:taurine transport system permease protein
VLNWVSEERAAIAAILILLLIISFVVSIYIGVKQTAFRQKDEVFGDPERTLGGWYWTVTGVSTILLLWFYFSWGVGRAFFPESGNEMCQIAKLETAIAPITAALPLNSRYYKSTTLIKRNNELLNILQKELPLDVFTKEEQNDLNKIITNSQKIIGVFSSEKNQSSESKVKLERVSFELSELSRQLRSGFSDLKPTQESLQQAKWGTTYTEIPLLPITPKGVLFDNVSNQANAITKTFLRTRNKSTAADDLIDATKETISKLKNINKSSKFKEDVLEKRFNYIKSVERIFKRLDDGTIFPPQALNDLTLSVTDLFSAIDETKGNLKLIDMLFIPGDGVVKSKTQCTEQGSGRWLPKPTDVIATFLKLADPDIENGGGYKGSTLLWWKWLPIADMIAFIIPDSLVDVLPGDYGRHSETGKFQPTFKDGFLALAQGDIYLGAIPVLDGHIWDSLFRVIVALMLGIGLGVPLGIYMGVSRFFKSFFDPIIELYRPVPPLAWAPLVLTIFGIQDDGKIFLLFMVAFAIMVISARTGASGTQLSKIRASHSLGASDRQILRYVILPNALPEILTGIRIAIGVCWGTLVAAEMLAGTTGIGFIENVARVVSNYELIWVTILIMGLLGLAFDIMMRWLINKTIPWRGKG